MDFCYKTASTWQFVGQLLFILKIMIPIVIIVLGSIDVGKAVISSDDKAVSKAAKTLLNRVIAGVCIFFIPTIVGLVFKMVGAFGEVKDQYDYCAACVSNPTGNKCSEIKGNS